MARAPYWLSLDEYAALFARITCPTLLLHGSESFLKDPQMTGILTQFGTAQFETIAGAGHWLQHDEPDAVFRILRPFLGTKA